MERACEQCGAPYTPIQCHQRYCSPSCARRHRYLHGRRKECQCRRCKKMFVPKMADRTKFCGRACSDAHRKELAVARKLVQGMVIQPVRNKLCVECGKAFSPSNVRELYCSDACRKAVSSKKALAFYYRRVPRITEAMCSTCGKPFVPSNRKAKLCDDCVDLPNKIRCRKFGMTREELFRRDNFRCGICGQMTNPNTVVPHPDAPTIDHIIPLARGGEHTPDNMQCAHFRCNCMKSDSVPSEAMTG